METYTIQLIERIEAGDNEALKELKVNNVLDVGMSAMSIAGALASRACNSCYKEARSIENTEKYGSKAVEGAMKHSDDNEEEFKVAWLPKKSSFECFEVANNVKGGKPYLRIHDTEYKILSEIDEILNGDINATGKITLFTEKTCCESCSDVIAQFFQKYPNIEIEVIHNNNIPVI